MLPSGCVMRNRALPVTTALWLFWCRNVEAGNGLNDIAYSAEGSAMGGADLAVARDPGALDVNPAGLAQTRDRMLSVDLEPVYYLDTQHRDAFNTGGNDMDTPFTGTVSGGYVQRIANTDVVVGIGAFVQGGAGFTYDNLNTAVGMVDDISALFGSFKLAPGVAWQATDRLSVGAALGITYSTARQKFFPDTSVGQFNGSRLDGLSGFGANGKLGFQYRLSDRWVVAGAYTSKTPIKLSGGTTTVDYDSMGAGKVRYASASLTGLNIAQEAGMGFSFQPTQGWLIAGEVNWVDWSSAMKASTLHASQPDSTQEGVPQTLTQTSALNWRDQYVVAIGVAYNWDDRTTLRAGYNYGRDPIPAGTLNPLLAVTTERSISVGFSRRLDRSWELQTSATYQPPVKVTYTNPQLPFGPDAKNDFAAMVLRLELIRRW